MNAPVEPWPRRVRYPLVAALVVLGVVGLVLAVTQGVDPVVWRVLVAAVLVPALLLPAQLAGVRRRSHRLSRGLAAQLDELTALVHDERARVPHARSTGASDDDLVRAASWVEVARQQVGAGDPGAQATLEQLERSTRGWVADAPTTLAVARCARSARTLSRVSRRAG